MTPEKMIVATDSDGVKRWVPAPVTSPPTVPDGYPCPLCGAMFPLNPDGCKSTCKGCGMTYCGDPDEVDGLIPVLNEADWEVLRKARLPSRYLPKQRSTLSIDTCLRLGALLGTAADGQGANRY